MGDQAQEQLTARPNDNKDHPEPLLYSKNPMIHPVKKTCSFGYCLFEKFSFAWRSEHYVMFHSQTLDAMTQNDVMLSA